MSSNLLRRSTPYAVAIAATSLAILLSLWLQPYLVRAIGAFFYVAVLFSTWYGGLGPGAMTVVLSTLAINYYFVPPVHQFVSADPEDGIRLGIFALTAFVINLLSSNLQYSKGKVERLSQQLIQESSDRLRMALTAARMGMWDWNLVTKEIVWSPEHEQLFGLAPGTFDGRYETFDACLHPDDRAGLEQAVQSAFQNRTSFQSEFRVIWADGSVHWLEGRGQAFHDPAGQPIQMLGTVMAIDDRKLIEAQRNQLVVQEQAARKAAQTTQERLTTILESISDAFVALDSEWRYTYVNQKAGQLFNRRPEDLVGESIWTEFPEGVGQAFYHAYYRAVAEQQMVQLEEYYPPWDRWFENRIYPAKEGLTIFFQEITDRKRTEIALTNSEHYLRAILDAEPECVKVITGEGILRRINPAGLAIVEADSLEQVQGQSIFSLIKPTDRAAFQAFTRRVAQGQADIFEFEGTGLKGTHRWLESHAVPFAIAGEATPLVLAITRDITERKQAEAALRQSEERWQLAIAGSNDGIWDHDLTTNQHFLSPRCLEITGYNLEEIDTFDRWLALIHPDDILRLQTTFQRHLQQHNSKYACEYRLRNKAGQYRWVLARGQSLWNDAGVPVRAVGSLTDITEQKQAEAEIKQLNAELEQRVTSRTAELATANNQLHIELFKREVMERALQESELKFRALFDQSSRVIALVQPNGILFENNQLSRELTAKTGETIVGRPLWELSGWGKANQAQVKLAFEQSLAGKVSHLELDIHELDDSLLRTPNGNPVTHNITIKAVKNIADQVMFLTVEGWDISQLRQAEASLREFHRRWRSLLNTAQLLVVELNLEGNVEYANPFFLQLTGYRAEEVCGQNWFDGFLSPGQKQSAKICFREVLERNFQIHYQNPILTKAGEERMIAWNNTLLRDASGQPIGTISIGEDVTERYQLERMKAEFISVVSHELRTPLTSMQAALSLLVEKIIDPTSEEGETIIQIAAEGVDRLVRLVNDILDLERLNSGKVRLEKQLCNTANLLTIAVEQMQEMANQAGIQLEVSAPSLEVVADFDRLLQVLLNLLSNAIKFSPINSIIWSSIAPQGPSLLFTVQDQGRGIPVDKLESIFERFQQVDASDSREKGGTGLGLAICRNIIQQHGGQIWAESTSEGSTFRFTIPTVEVPTVEETSHDIQASSSD